MDILKLTILGLIAGLLDSIAGGGGLITIPSLSMFLGLGPLTIGTNKIVAVTSTGIALLVYLKKGHFDFKKAIFFAIFISIGSLLGSLSAGFVPKDAYRYLLIITAPIILWLIFNKKFWLSEGEESYRPKKYLLVLSGLVVGFYDGVWGPGGGTFMLLSLLFINKLPIISAIAISKFANLVSASSSLAGYALTGNVNWKLGLLFAIPIAVGAFLGANLATKKAEKIVRPILLIVVILLIIKVYTDS
jgi:uncharacterized membrane protein YfcA